MAYTFFYRKEVEMVTKIVTLNRYIKVLDLSYSYLGDRGLSTLSRGLIAQTQNGFGIRELNLVNTSISENAEEILPSIIVRILHHNFVFVSVFILLVLEMLY